MPSFGGHNGDEELGQYKSSLVLPYITDKTFHW